MAEIPLDIQHLIVRAVHSSAERYIYLHGRSPEFMRASPDVIRAFDIPNQQVFMLDGIVIIRSNKLLGLTVVAQ